MSSLVRLCFYIKTMSVLINSKIYVRKGVALEMYMDCGNCMLAALNFSLIHFLKLKIPIVHKLFIIMHS